MNFDLGPDERALQASIREMCAAHFGVERIMKEGMTSERWRALDDAGVFSLRVAEEHGGVGLGLTHAAVVFEELGRELVHGPIVDTHIGRTRGATEAVIGVIERDARVIHHLPVLDVVAVMDEEGLWRVAPGDVDAEEVDSLDPLTPTHRIRALPKGDLIVGAFVVSGLRADLALLTAAQLVGIAAQTTDLAVAYAKEREQFDRPIGSFQAVKHLCADMLVRTEVARAAVYAAACILEDPECGDPARALAAAKLLANEAALANGKACVQVHGGMGFTWEVPVHLYLKRAAVLASVGGTTHAREEEMAAFL